MKKIFVMVMMFCFMFLCVSCQNNKVKFDVFEEDTSLIGLYVSNMNEMQFDGEELKIYKNYSEMIDDLNNKGLAIKDNTFSEKYCDEFFENKSLVLYYSIDSSAGYKYTFKSIKIINNELLLNIEINKEGAHATIETPRLFIIEINKNDINDFEKLKYKIKVVY